MLVGGLGWGDVAVGSTVEARPPQNQDELGWQPTLDLQPFPTKASKVSPDGEAWKPSQPISSVAQLCPTLCDPMDCSTPGLPVHHQLLEFTQTLVH